MKKPLKKTFLAFKKWVKNIQTAGYNGARTVDPIYYVCAHWSQFWHQKIEELNDKLKNSDFRKLLRLPVSPILKIQ